MLDVLQVSDAVEHFWNRKEIAAGRAAHPRSTHGRDVVTVTTLHGEAPAGPRSALIAGRTPDNPTFFREAIAAGATHVLLEKPGAPSVGELEAMAFRAFDEVGNAWIKGK